MLDGAGEHHYRHQDARRLTPLQLESAIRIQRESFLDMHVERHTHFGDLTGHRSCAGKGRRPDSGLFLTGLLTTLRILTVKERV
jgi:hypothetical protein